MFECSLGITQRFINLKYFFISRTEFLTQVTQEKILDGLRTENLGSHKFVHRFLYHGRIVIGDSNLENMTVT